ncbi:serine/threonine-protein kinase [Streptomyces sp. DSM 3412]|uniref:Serine/threonine-protein kinase n=1 Tax=Streptomyces gottesmaniae TaxID=3075518 RepID=A0ABU2Z707_9ACTN|nr:serine/threonine-protein kinase [Streptomyces sp. DSM 3412]MDT0571986.1 serine/threonine-protein kinase [Streptomyces sp. DSM 3412]
MRIGPYVVERELGSGGMGTVYLARSRGGRAVAVKVARPELAVDPAFRARFRVEIEAARRVGGFHTAPVVDADPDGAPPWLATAYVPGPTLAARLATDGPMEEGTVRQLGAALAEALQAIHACGLVHRDLKPGNIVMAADGPRVLDFGIARAIEDTRLTATGHAFGTPGFLAPEQAVGADVTGAADIFALGAVLVVAAGGRPFGDGTPMALMYRSVHEEADLTPLPLALRPVAASCLAKNPADRPTPSALLDLLTTPGPQGGPPVHTSTPYLPPGDPSDAGKPLSRPSATHARRRDDDTFGTRTTDSPRSFTAAADRSRVVVDEEGVLLQADTTEIEFPWEEIGAVTTTVTGLGRVLRVTVRTYEGESYSVDVRAPNRRLRKAWSLRMDRVLARHLDG